ncbi:uncharacterized protein [Epargyreus clarus]|uniref:uncharacterized protein n=1 Tax=Epargyreus clarus TaxID=520877 RepID=UPI003C2E9224
MGRKIPAKKHRGVKDPLEQQARRWQSLKGKINAPPKDPDEQPVPRSLTRLFAFQDKDKTIKKKKLLKHTPSRDVGPASGVGENPIARLKKLPGESGRGFSLRINSAVRALHDPLEQDYPEDLEDDDVKGEQMAAQRARRRRKRARAAGGGEPRPPKQSRAQKLALKRNAMKMKADEEARGEAVYERVAFGEVCAAPPALAAPRRAAPPPGAPRPGRRDLLLSALLAGGAGAGGAGAGGAGGAAELLRRERARLDAVAAYRALKKQKQMQQHAKKK